MLSHFCTNVLSTHTCPLAGSLPGMNQLISMIRSRRRRDAIIVGCVVGVCLILLLMYAF